MKTSKTHGINLGSLAFMPPWIFVISPMNREEKIVNNETREKWDAKQNEYDDYAKTELSNPVSIYHYQFIALSLYLSAYIWTIKDKK